MHVTVFGAAGNMRSRVVPEALAPTRLTADVVRDLVRIPATTKGE